MIHTLLFKIKSSIYGGITGAAINDKWDMVSEFLSRGEDPNYLGSFDRSALHCAVLREKHEIIALLLKYKANPNIMSRNIVWENNIKETPLHLASKIGSVNAVKMLVMYGGDIEYQDQHLGKTPEDVACNSHIREVMQKHAEARNKINQLLDKNKQNPPIREIEVILIDLLKEDDQHSSVKISLQKAYIDSVIKLAATKSIKLDIEQFSKIGVMETVVPDKVYLHSF
jgi:hypothetical protein